MIWGVMSISLKKGERLSLDKPGGLTRVRMGLGWDPAKGGWFSRGKAVDMDASCILFAGEKPVDTVWFKQLASRDGSVSHSGDNRTGDGEGDDESIVVDLARLPAEVDGLAFTVNSFTGETFEKVANCRCRLLDEAGGGQELCHFALSEQGAHQGVLMAVMKKSGTSWSFRAVGAPGTGRTFDALLPVAAAQLRD